MSKIKVSLRTQFKLRRIFMSSLIAAPVLFGFRGLEQADYYPSEFDTLSLVSLIVMALTAAVMCWLFYSHKRQKEMRYTSSEFLLYIFLLYLLALISHSFVPKSLFILHAIVAGIGISLMFATKYRSR